MIQGYERKMYVHVQMCVSTPAASLAGPVFGASCRGAVISSCKCGHVCVCVCVCVPATWVSGRCEATNAADIPLTDPEVG